MVILGGTGNLAGSLVGAVLLVVLRLRPQGLLPESASAHHYLAPPERPRVDRPVAAAALEGRGLEKRFGGIVAVSKLDLALAPGHITGLIGPNGAGKTTAFNLLTGFIEPDAGEVAYRGRLLKGLKPHRIVRLGIARAFQDLKLFTRLTVLENVLVALPRQRGDHLAHVYFTPWAVAREERANLGRAMAILEFVGLQQRAAEPAADLSYAEEKLLAVARLLATDAEVLLFDEPLSGLAPNTLREMQPIFRRLADSGRTLAIIEHNLDVIRELCDTAVFLDEGRKLAEGTPERLMQDPVLAERYFK